MSAEARALVPWHAKLFDAEAVDLARRRLDAYQFDVDAVLRDRTGSPPDWVARQVSDHESP